MTHEEHESIAALDALGVADAEEERALRAHVASCDACRRAREEFAEAVTLLARDLPPSSPPGEVRERVLSAIASADSYVIDGARRIVHRWWLATAATVFLALWGWREIAVRVARERIHSQLAEIQQLRNENALLEQQKDKLSAAMTSMTSVGGRTISLMGREAAPSASAKVFLDPNARTAIVFFTSLPVNPSDKSYQLWVIPADAAKPPMSGGVFDVTQSGSATVTVSNLPVATEMKALAVTLEPRGGVDAPTNTNFYVVGDT